MLAGAVAIVAYAVVVGALIFLKPPPVRFVYVESSLTKGGELIFRREGCLSCHELFGNGTTYGPPLDGVGSRRDRTVVDGVPAFAAPRGRRQAVQAADARLRHAEKRASWTRW